MFDGKKTLHCVCSFEKSLEVQQFLHKLTKYFTILQFIQLQIYIFVLYNLYQWYIDVYLRIIDQQSASMFIPLWIRLQWFDEIQFS